MRVSPFVCLIAMPLLIATGCSSGKAPTSSLPTKKGNAPRETTEVILTEGTLTDLDQAVKDTDQAVVLVEFWTLATEPSSELSLANNSRAGIQQARGPSLGKDKVAWHGIRKAQFMAQKYEGYFLRVIAVNMDGVAKKDEVLKHLKSHDARHVTNLIWKDDAPKAAERYGFNGKVPHQIVFGRKGDKVWATGDPLATTLDDLLFTELDK
jgi:hypothetical protein